MKDFRNTWANMSAQKRRLFLLGAAMTLLLLGWALIWQPLNAAHKAARAAHAETLAQYAEIRILAAQIASRAQGRDSSAGAQSPLAAIEAMARDLHLLEPLKRREADGANGARLVLEGAPADALMHLLEQLEQRHGLRVVQAQIDPVGPGRVNASLSLQRGRSGA